MSSNHYLVPCGENAHHLGTTRVTFRADGPGSIAIDYAADYYPYAKILREYRVCDPDRYLSTYHERDQETGYDNRGARLYDSEIGRFLGVDPLAGEFAPFSPYNYVLGNPVRLIDPDGRAPENIEPIVTKGGGKDGRDLVTYKVTGKIINRSSSELDMDKILADVTAYVKNEFQGQDIDGVDYQVELDFSVANSMDDVSEDDHLLSIVDEITLTRTTIGANGPSTKTTNGDGVVSGFGEKAAFVDASVFTGPYDSSVGSNGAYTAAHEIGHLLNLKHRNKPLNLMKTGSTWVSSGNWSTIVTDNQMRTIRDSYNNQRLNRGSNRTVPRTRGNGWNVYMQQ